ncbi:hypothetical protein CEXT_205571 [Caerostris extrusa]|uniref:G-protein coupled receptors family 1 profile domain-containing protein n=1 Tax=Caerostris extrusa TaxID=172846 RepID=A0AAV4Y6G1_CAEEX|nr:hypothetical protein CEXT_205571 [Caerostris extrusa]
MISSPPAVLTAVLSNSLVLLVMGVRKKKLRTFQLCLISMCVSDLLFSLCLHPMSIATALGYDAKRIFSHSGCLYFGIMALFFGTYDMVAHSLIAVLRYMNLCQPTGESISKRCLLSLLVACVLYSLVWSIGPAFNLGKYETFEVGCTMAFADQTLPGKVFVNCAFIFCLLSSFGRDPLQLRGHRAGGRQAEEGAGEAGNRRGTNRLAVELKLVRLTSVIATAYVVAWFPYAVVCLYETYGDQRLLPPDLQDPGGAVLQDGRCHQPHHLPLHVQGLQEGGRRGDCLASSFKRRTEGASLLEYPVFTSL